ncbi:F-box/FBD/LRR-repeat protein [Forsythia ovata]|uniref:F-box/FBD/LRR-repeat protein n=1 Tax=Forsythia ovata TaxID=205694 RepID=A0ABD1WT05_9LAMI
MEIAPFPPIDMISNLPDNVMDNILTHLTIRDAVKTSILSKQWKYKWVNLPQLIFDDTLWQKSEGNQEVARIKFTSIIYHVLLFHRGPITKFTLIIPQLRSCSEIDHLIYFLSKNGVEEFTFKIWDRYMLPSSLFMCLQLKHLNLCFCGINPPPSFNGFKRLIRLELTSVTVDGDGLGNLISSCPLLEQLVLHVSNKVDYLEIDAPVLQLFELVCSNTYICFKKSPLLAIVSVASYNERSAIGDGICNLIEFLESLPALQKLQMNYNFLKLLAADKVQTTIPATLNNLKILELTSISLHLLEELSSVLCLIRSSPNLEKLKITMYSDETDDTSDVMDFLKVQDYSDVTLNRLQEVTLKSFTGTLPEMALIKLLLEKSSKLKIMDIFREPYKVDDIVFGILIELNKFWRASPKVEVNFECPE